MDLRGVGHEGDRPLEVRDGRRRVAAIEGAGTAVVQPRPPEARAAAGRCERDGEEQPRQGAPYSVSRTRATTGRWSDARRAAALSWAATSTTSAPRA